MRKWIIGFLLIMGLATLASADTLDLNSAPWAPPGPYYFYVDGSTALTPLICFSDVNEITYGETWQVAVYTIADVTSITGSFAGSAYQYNLIGYLANELFANPGNVDIQNALWFVLGKGGSSNSWYTGAVNYLAANPGYETTDIFYIPVYDNDSWESANFDGLGQPQPFVGEAPIPEPTSLIMFGTGIFACAGIIRRKFVGIGR